jgi:hypothetical protein
LQRCTFNEGIPRRSARICSQLASLMGTSLFTDEAGLARLSVVVPGDYSVEAGTGKDADVRSLTITVGQTSHAKLMIGKS